MIVRASRAVMSPFDEPGAELITQPPDDAECISRVEAQPAGTLES